MQHRLRVKKDSCPFNTVPGYFWKNKDKASLFPGAPSKSGPHCTIAAKRKEAPDDVASVRKRSLFPFCVSALSASRQASFIFTVLPNCLRLWKTDMAALKTTHRLLLWSQQGGALNTSEGSSHCYEEQKHQRRTPQAKGDSLGRCRCNREQMRVLRPYGIVVLRVLIRALTFDIPPTGESIKRSLPAKMQLKSFHVIYSPFTRAKFEMAQ